MLPGMYEISYAKGDQRKNSHNTVDLRHLSLMLNELKVHSIDIMLQLYYSKELKVHSIYNVVSNPNIQIQVQFKALVYFELQESLN